MFGKFLNTPLNKVDPFLANASILNHVKILGFLVFLKGTKWTY